ncbi:SGNH/GDSL hydrolase family protein [Pelomonas sp. KK5]|uniref:SGNH/GDSL hydrolase family protein n=1 Tax=Pelomonas sp. KK5 TaxID=1855730 RepID=UPI00097BEB8D|nr:SGNH/GDSL hydrolase family protein [Pelomonas sp. KK5]
MAGFFTSASSWPRLARALLLVAAGTATAGAAPAYTNLYVFGDSLSDVGNDFTVTGGAVPTASFYSQGRFSNGPTYADQLAAGLGLGPLLPSVAGGTDYAFGGARVAGVAAGLPPTALSFNQQLAAYGSAHASADAGGLYLLWIGANDMSDALGQAALGNAAAVPAAINTTLTALGTAIQGLAAKGATHFLIPDLPDLSLIPAARAQAQGDAGTLATIKFVSQSFNGALAGMLANPGFASLDIHTLDVFSLQNAATAGAYGFSNVTDACYSGGVNGLPLTPGGPAPTVCADPGSYLYWDYEHPSAALHAVLGAEALAAAVPEPSSALLLLPGLLVVATMRRWKTPRHA